MPRLWWLPSVVIAILAPLVFLFATASAAANCEFVLGFKTLHDLIPGSIGECAENVRYNPLNGDALQNTSKGMLVWRKSDNFTAFTDGYRTWVNGPYGIQQRLNTERFDWENDPLSPNLSAATPFSAPPPSPSCSLPPDAVTFDQFVPDYGGAAYGKGTVRNPCDQSINVAIDVFAHSSKDGPIIMDAPTIWVSNLAPHSSKPIGVRVPKSPSSASFSWRVDATSSTKWCQDASGTQCAWVDPSLASAFYAVTSTDEGRSLAAAAEINGIRIVRGQTGVGILGFYRPSAKTITIDRRLDANSSWVRAAVLSHELQHAADYSAGAPPASAAECYKAEERAFRTEATFWTKIWKNQLPQDADEMHIELNDIAVAEARNPEGFALSLATQYGSECGAE